MPYEADGHLITETRQLDAPVGTIDATTTLPAGTSAGLTVYQDITGNGSPDNQTTVALADGTQSYHIPREFDDAAGDYWLRLDLATTDDTVTPSVDRVEIAELVESELSSEVSVLVDLPVPIDLQAVVAGGGDQLDASWTLESTDEDGVRLSRRLTGGSGWTQVGGDLPAGTEQATTGPLLDGEQYDLRVEVFTDETTSSAVLSPAATTVLPDLADADVTLRNGVEDEIQVELADITNNGSYRIQIRETGASAWDASAAGWAEAVLSSDGDTTGIASTIFANREDGEEYEVRARSETPHTTGAWTTPASIIAKFPGSANLEPTAISTTSITIGWDENSDNETGQWVERRREEDNYESPTQWTAWQQLEDVGPDVETYVDDDLDSNWKYQYRVRAYTEHTDAVSNTVTVTTDVQYEDGVFLEFRQDGDIITFDNDQIAGGAVPDEHSVINQWTITLPPEPGLEDWLHADAYIWYDQTLLTRGEFTRPETTDRQATILKGTGVLGELRRGGAREVYENIKAHAALKDYLDTHAPSGWTINVVTPTPSQIDDDALVQDAATTTDFNAIFTIDATSPFEIASDSLSLLQTCFTVEAEGYDRGTVGTTIGWVGTDGRDFSAAGGASAGVVFQANGEYAEYDFTTEYTIPGEDFDVYFRWDKSPDDGTNNRVEFILDPGAGGESLGIWETSGTGVEWRTGGLTLRESISDLSPGQHTLRIEQIESGEADDLAIDVVAPVDTRHSVTLDNTVDGNGLLSGPEHYPAATLAATQHDSTFNVSAASLNVVATDTSGGQTLEVSNDGGATWLPSDGTEANTDAITVDFSSTIGSTITGRVTLSGYGSRTTATPTEDYQGQSISSWELRIDTTDLPVIDSREYTGSRFENVQALARDARMRFVADPSESSVTLDVFQAGDITKSVSWKAGTPTRTMGSVPTKYANSVTVRGAINPADETERLQATAKSQTAIQADGETLEAPAVFRPKIETEADLESVARTRLAEHLAADSLTGQVEIPLQRVRAGYSYEVPEIDGLTLALESSTLDLTGGSTTLDFEGRERLAQRLAGITSEVRSVRDAV